MVYPVVMFVADQDAPRITRVWDVLSEGNYSQDQISYNRPPHITLALVKDEIEPDILIAALQTITAAWKPIPVFFDSITFLLRSTAPMLARPDVTLELLKANAEVCGGFAPEAVVDYSKPGAWQPHTTFARDIKVEQRGEALQAVLECWTPLRTTLDRVALFHSEQDVDRNWHVRELWRHEL